MAQTISKPELLNGSHRFKHKFDIGVFAYRGSFTNGVGIFEKIDDGVFRNKMDGYIDDRFVNYPMSEMVMIE